MTSKTKRFVEDVAFMAPVLDVTVILFAAIAVLAPERLGVDVLTFVTALFGHWLHDKVNS